MRYDEFLSRLKTNRRNDTSAQCICPAHDDDNASLTVGIGNNGSIVLKCHAGCSVDDILRAMGLKLPDLYDSPMPKKKHSKIYQGTSVKYTYYPYTDENDNYVYDMVRIDTPGKKKDFRAKTGDKWGLCGQETILYRLSGVIRAIRSNDIIFLPEGEKCCNIIHSLGLTATTNPFGGAKWKESYSKTLTWGNVIIIPDNDVTGERHYLKVSEELKNCTKSLKILFLPNLPEKGDIEEWVHAGGTKEKLLELAAAAPIYKPESEKIEKTCFYYDSGKKEYLYRNKRRWLSLDQEKFKKNLINLGYSQDKPKAEKMSEVDFKILDIRENNDIDFSGPLAGYKSGYYEIGETRMLITHGPKLIYPKKGNCEMVLKIIDNLLTGENDVEGNQLQVFLCWLKIAYESLLNYSFRPGQVIVFAGTRDCGKSLLQKIITEMLGGRSARPYKYMTEQTEFNGDLFGAEHLVIEDEVANTDIRSRRAFGAKIKEMAANEGIKCRAMHREGIELKPFWRVSISVNDEPENLLTLPPIDESLEDKIIILRAFKKPMPMRTAKNEDRQKFWSKIIGELPALAEFLVSSVIPEDMVSERYGIKHFHNKYILDEINQLSPEKRLLDLIDMSLFARDEMAIVNEYVLTAHDLESKLHENQRTHNEAGKLLTWTTTCSTYLGRLSKKYSHRVQRDGKEWIIRRDGVS